MLDITKTKLKNIHNELRWQVTEAVNPVNHLFSLVNRIHTITMTYDVRQYLTLPRVVVSLFHKIAHDEATKLDATA